MNRNLQIINGDLSLPRKKPSYSNRLYINDDRCVGCWLFNEGGGNTAYDISQNNNHGVLTNGPAWTGGDFGGTAVDFDGANDYVNMGDPNDNSLDFGTENFSASLWLKTADIDITNGSHRIIHKYAENAGFSIYLQGTGSAGQYGRLALEDNSANNITASPPGGATFYDAKWHHLVCVVDRIAGIATFYNNAVPQTGTINISSITGSINNNLNLYLGMYNSNIQFFYGLIDNVSIYNAALSASEIADLYYDPFKDIKKLEPMVFGWTAPAVGGISIPAVQHHRQQQGVV